MRLLGLEMKRILKTRSTYIIAGLGLVMTIGLVFLLFSYEKYYYMDENGNSVEISGPQAVKEKQKLREDLSSEITPELAREAFEIWHEVYEEYGRDEESIPTEVYYEKIYPIYHIINCVSQSYEINGYPIETSEISPDMAADFYEKRKENVVTYMNIYYEDYPDAAAKALELDAQVDIPFTYSYGVGSNAMDYIILVIWIGVILGVIITVPVFSADYQNGSDDILRCTKYGKVWLAVVKSVSALLITMVIFAIMVVGFVLTVNTLYGWQGLDTSMQMVSHAAFFAPFTIGEIQKMVIIQAFASMVGMICFTLFLSAKSKNPVTTMLIAFGFCLAPMLMGILLSGNIIEWIRVMLPSNSTMFQTCYYYAVRGFEFLFIGDKAIWVPHAMVVVTVIEIPLFLGLTIYSYCKYKRN